MTTCEANGCRPRYEKLSLMFTPHDILLEAWNFGHAAVRAEEFANNQGFEPAAGLQEFKLNPYVCCHNDK